MGMAETAMVVRTGTIRARFADRAVYKLAARRSCSRRAAGAVG